MGQQIVYCGTCGTSLRHDDFEKGKAVEVDAIPYCRACLPAPLAEKLARRPEAARSSISSTRIRTLTGSPSGTRRKSAGEGRKSSLPYVLAGAGALVLVLVIVFLSGGAPPPPRISTAPPA